MSRRVLLLNFLAILWCGIVLNVRFHLVGHHSYFFLLWNLFLAVIPLGLSLGLLRIKRLSIALPLLGLWLLFFPNAPYVLTDLIHLTPHNRGQVPLWFDLLMLLSFGLVSLWFGFQSLRFVQGWITRNFSKTAGWCVTIVTLLLSGFGVYLGRFLRWNSWDVLRRPRALLGDIGACVVDPSGHSQVWGFTFGFGGMLIFVYMGWALAEAGHPRAGGSEGTGQALPRERINAGASD